MPGSSVPGVEIRSIRPSDLNAVNLLISMSLDQYFSPEIPSYFMGQWPRGSYVAVDFAGNIIGYIGGSMLQGARASVSLLCVSSLRRGSGIGGALLSRLMAAAVMEGVRTVQLEVRTTNLDAVRFYERRGFMKTEYLPGFYSDGGDGVRMVASAFSSNN